MNKTKIKYPIYFIIVEGKENGFILQHFTKRKLAKKALKKFKDQIVFIDEACSEIDDLGLLVIGRYKKSYDSNPLIFGESFHLHENIRAFLIQFNRGFNLDYFIHEMERTKLIIGEHIHSPMKVFTNFTSMPIHPIITQN